METTIQLTGLHCDACLKVSARRIKKIEGVTDAVVNINGQARIIANRHIQKEEVREVLKDTEYSVM